MTYPNETANTGSKFSELNDQYNIWFMTGLKTGLRR